MTQLTALNSRPGAGSSGGGGLVKPTNDHDQSPLISIYFENLFFFWWVLLQTSCTQLDCRL